MNTNQFFLLRYRSFFNKWFTKQIVLVIISFLGITSGIFAQTKISGKIINEEGVGVSQASVTEKGKKNGTITSDDGSFTLSVNNLNGSLVVSSVGFVAQELPISGRTSLNISLKSGNTKMEEVVVVGYGTQKKVTVTGAVSAIKGENLVKSPAVDLSNSLAGRLPGLVVIQQSGEPGADAATITIRGTNTRGNTSPLVVIDGIPDRDGGLGRINPGDVESISVLKDASAAIYGARAANGAVLVTTKKGQIGKPKITYDFNQGYTQPARIPKLANASEYAAIMNELPIYNSIPINEWSAAWTAIQQTGKYTSPTAGISTLNANYSPTAVQKFADGTDPWRYPNTDWFADAFKIWSPQSRHNLSISGGTENLRFFTSLGYVNQDAVYHESATRYQQYNFRTNLSAKISDFISTSFGIMVRREDRRYPTESAGSIFRMLMRGRPTEPEVWPKRPGESTGLPGPDIENGQNPYVITTNATGYSDNPRDYIQSNGSVEITNPWIKGLKLTLSGAIDKSSGTSKTWQTPWTLYSWDKVTYEADGVTPKLVGAIRSNFTDARLTQTYGQLLNINKTAILNYDHSIGNHTFSIMAGVTKETFKGEGFLAFRRNYISPAVDQLFAGGSLQQNTDGSAFERARLGYYGRVQYNYKEKYLAEFIWRDDGSYIFPESKRFGFFPGLLVGWNIAKENFFKVPAINALKLRASYGQMGNDQVFFRNELQEYAYLSTYNFGTYPINNDVITTLNETFLVNQNFTWERAKNYNFGLDATLFNNKVDLILEYFKNRRDRILIQSLASTPGSAGILDYLPPVNGGGLENKGFEFSVAYNSKIGKDLQFKVGVNGGYAKNKVIILDEKPGAPDYQAQKGKPLDAYLVYKYAGVFKDQAEIDKNTVDYSSGPGKVKPGDMKFEDINGDNKIDQDDQVRLDKSLIPTLNFGATVDLRYKSFELNILFQGATGAAVRIQTESGDIGNFLKYSYDHRWTIDNPSSVDPRLASRGDTYYTGGSYGNNTYFLFSKNYVRLKNIQLAYNLPASILNRAGISNMKVFVNGLNVFTIDKNKIFDPEATVQSGVYYPQLRVINFGATLTF